MRTTPLIAAALLASSAASAQVGDDACRSDTISALARCAAERAPAPVEETAPTAGMGEIAPLNPQRVQPSNLGGALQPSNLRTNPPVVGPANQPARAAEMVPSGVGRFDPLGRLGNDPGSPLYGLGRTDVDRRTAIDPLAGTGIGADR